MSSSQSFFRKRLATVRLGAFEFSPGWLTTLLTVLLLILLVNLGLWQKNRGDTKRAMAERYEERSRSGDLRLQELIELDTDSMDYPVELSGQYLHGKSFLLDNRTHRGIPGFQVITPLDVGSHYVLVNRGWVPQGKTRQEIPEFPRPDNKVTIEGITHVPNPDYFVLEEDSYENVNWPFIIQKIDLEKSAQLFDKRLAPFTVRLNPEENAGFVREWHSNPMTPEKHYGYAFQWFSLALALLVIYVTVNARKITSKQKNNDPLQ
ncbi:MAG: SURF1 family protein [Ketobacteraceae bacterium]|nr:SURF1 family protein [Ketobacteraceae bacterium]